MRKDSCERTGSFRTRAKNAFVRSSTAMVSVAPPCMSFSRTAPTMRSSAGPTTTVYITSHDSVSIAEPQHHPACTVCSHRVTRLVDNQV